MEAEANTEGQEQIPPVRAVARRVRRRSTVWEDFSEVPESQSQDGKTKAICKHCHKSFEADSKRYGTNTLLRHAKSCKQGTDGSVATDEHESDRLIGMSTSVNAITPSRDSLASLLFGDYDLQTTQMLCDNQPPAPSPPIPFDLSPSPASVPPATPLGSDPHPPPVPPQLSVPCNPPLLLTYDQQRSLNVDPSVQLPFAPAPSHHDQQRSLNVDPSVQLPFTPAPSHPDQQRSLNIDPSVQLPFAPAPSHPDQQRSLNVDPSVQLPFAPAPSHPDQQRSLNVNPSVQLPFAPAPSHPDGELPDQHEHGPEDEEARKHLARMIALNGYDPSLVEDNCFRSFVGSLNPRFRFPSRLAVEQMCGDIFDEVRKGLFSRLSLPNRKVSLAVGTTQTIHGEVLYTACHFIDDEWNLHQVVLDAYQVAESPILYGPLLGVSEVAFGVCDMTANVILRDFYKHGVLDKLFAMVWSTKNSSEIQRHMKQFISVDITRCVDIVLHSIAGPPMMLDANFIIDIYNEVKALDLTRESLQQFFSKHGLDDLRIHGRYWYSYYCSLMFLRKPGSCTIADKDYSQLVELLCKIWGVIYHAIQRISTFRHPSSNQCLVELFKVREVLQSELERTDGDNSIVCRGYHVFKNKNDDVADVLREAKDTLDSILQDIYLVWSVPLVLDPRYKLTYIKFVFSRAFGSRGARYISEVTRKIKKIYADYVEFDDARINGASSDGVIDEMAAGSSTAPLGQACNEHCRSGDEMMDDIASHQDVDEIMRSLKDLIIDPLGQAWDKHCRSLDGRTDAGIYQNAEKELERYLNDPRVEATQDFDILNWWKDNNSKYPTVARMARDALAMPTCSKLSSEQMAQVSSIIHGYLKKR